MSIYKLRPKTILILSIFLGLALAMGLGAALSAGGGVRAAVPAESAGTLAKDGLSSSGYILLSWNDLGMHCYNRDFSDLAVLPPYNTLWAQVIQIGDPPRVITTGVQVTYVFTDNTTSVTKSNFWTFAPRLFGVALPADVGLAGKGLSGNMDVKGGYFEAIGIPLTEYRDSNPVSRYPYQVATVSVHQIGTGALLAQQKVVAPVSTEMRCDECHKNGGVAQEGVPPQATVEQNILALHDRENQSSYPAGHTGALMNRRPVLCAECHSSNALGAGGVAGLPSLSRAMHSKHAEEASLFPNTTSGCYKCHPGPQTQCLRDAMSSKHGMTCISCHGTLAQVSLNPNPWLNEPRCDTCHTAYKQDQTLYRMSKTHGKVYCEGCHDSTHAIAPSTQPNDALKFMALQGYPGTLSKCTVCHLTDPRVPFQHQINPNIVGRLYLPMTHR
jgi:hypothetical protein